MYEDCWFRNVTHAFSDIDENENTQKSDFSIKKKVKYDNHLNKDAKKQFLSLYLNDEIFRENVKDKYILFINQEYSGVYPNIDSMIFLGKSGDDKYCIKIFGYTEYEYSLIKHNVQPEYIKDNVSF